MAYHNNAVAIINNVGGQRAAVSARAPVTKRAADRDTVVDGFGAVADYYRPYGRERCSGGGRSRRRRRTHRIRTIRVNERHHTDGRTDR